MRKQVNVVIKFLKERPVLSILFFLSIWLLIKNSNIPMIYEPGFIGRLLFLTPQSDAASGIGKLMDVFTGAYATSLVFYFVVEYIPAENKRITAMASIYPEIKNLNVYLSSFINMLETSKRKVSVDSLDDLLFTDENIFVTEETIFKDKITKIEEEYNLQEDIPKYARLIHDSSKIIADAPLCIYCDEEFLTVLTMLQGSALSVFDFFNKSKSGTRSDYTIMIAQKAFKNQGFTIGNLQNKVNKFKSGLDIIRERYPELPDKRFAVMNSEEIESFKKNQAEGLSRLFTESQEKSNA